MVFADFEAKSKPNTCPECKTDESLKPTFYTVQQPSTNSNQWIQILREPVHRCRRKS